MQKERPSTSKLNFAQFSNRLAKNATSMQNGTNKSARLQCKMKTDTSTHLPNTAREGMQDFHKWHLIFSGVLEASASCAVKNSQRVNPSLGLAHS
jgi:hypothetical protein